MPEDKGFIGQRRDYDAALIYLNARYLDPKLGMFTQPDWLDVRLPGVGVNRFAFAGNDPVNLSDPGGKEVEWFEPDRTFNYRTGTDAHRLLADWVESATTFFAERPFFSGNDPLLPGLESGYRGRPDASQKLSPGNVEIFDWKPITHKDNASLKPKDRARLKKWEAELQKQGKSVALSDTRSIVQDGNVVGRVLGLPEGGIRREYEAVTFSSEEPGIAYCELRETGRYQRTQSDRLMQAFGNFKSGHSDSSGSPFWSMPSPTRLPIRP